MNFKCCKFSLWPVWLLVLLLVGCSSKGNLPPPTPLSDVDNALPLSRAWLKVNIAERERQQAREGIYADEAFFMWVDNRGRLHADDAQTGKAVWRSELDSRISSTPGVFADAVYVVTQNAEVIALQQQDGVELWRSPVSSEALVAPQMAEGIIIVYCVDGTVYGLNALDGSERWRYDSKVPVISVRGNATPAITKGRVILGLSDGQLASLDLWSGKEKWRVTLARSRGRTELERMVDVDVSPVVVGDVIYTAAYQGQLVALHFRSGRTLWSFDVSTAQDIAVSDEYVFVVDERSVIYAVDRRNGRVDWKQDGLQWRYATAPALFQDYLVVGDLEGYLHWVDQRSGKLLHRVWTDYYYFDSKPVVAGNKLYAMSRAGIIDVLQLDEQPTP